MSLRKLEEYILILVVIRTCYSLNGKQCSNAYTSCAQGQGVCKPECQKGEDKLGFCHGSSCSCCKRIQQGGDWMDDILTNELNKYYSDDFRLSKSYNWVVDFEDGGRNGQVYLRGKGRGLEQNEENYVKGQGCDFEGNLYADGAIWTVDCMDHKCNGGQLHSKLSPNCCEFEDHKYCDGDTWSNFCTLYTCNHGHLDIKDDEKCCEDDGQKYLSGDSWTEGCFDIMCHMGMLEEKQLASCCQANGTLYESDMTWTEACDHFKCNNGMIERSDSLTCCPGLGGVMKQSGETWVDECINKTCLDGTIDEKIANNICCAVNSTTFKESETITINNCEIHACKCTKYYCDFELTDDSECGELTPQGCIVNSTAFNESEQIFVNDCEIHVCKCTEDGCTFVLTDDSQCVELTTPQAITEEFMDEPDVKSGMNKYNCRHNNKWMEDGSTITEGCFKITCQGGCTCSEKLQHGCCYNDETEHKNEGETWEEHCIVYSCANGDITEKKSQKSECILEEEEEGILKEGECMYGGKEYIEGEAINYGCTIHQCISGKFISYPDPTCCVVDGHAYPSGSSWEEECYTSCCEMGLVKKINKGICNNCQGIQGCQESIQVQFQQIQPCTSCCTVGTAVYQNGQTWMDNCNSNTCNQGSISTVVMPNCGYQQYMINF